MATTTSERQGLRATDPDLAFLASRAAIDLDIRLNGQKPDSEACRLLADRLQRSTAISQDVSLNALMDSTTITMLNEAIAESITSELLQETDELISQADEIVASLRSIQRQDADPTKLERARDFCNALSRAALAYRTSIAELRRPHPARL